MTSRVTFLAFIVGLASPLGSAVAQEPVGRSSAIRTSSGDPFRNALYQVWDQPPPPKPKAAMLNLEFHPGPVPPAAAAAGMVDASMAAGFAGPEEKETPPAAARPHVVATALPPTKPAGKPAAPAKPEPQSGASARAAAVNAPAATLVDPLTLKQIPASESGRKAMSRQWLKDARVHLSAGRIDQAQAIADRLCELAIEYGRFEDNPHDLARDLAKARQKEVAAGLLPSSDRATR
jgi:hypothetical protein